jgi:hypothetical protein
LVHVAPFALVITAAILPVWGILLAPLATQDEAILLVFPEQLLSGRLPHRDFFTVYGPGGYSVLALVFKVFGTSVSAERGVALLYHAAVAVGVLALTRRCGRTQSVSAGCFSALLLSSLDLTAYAWLGALALVVWSLVLLTMHRSFAMANFSAGMMVALAGAFRPELLAVALLAALPLVWKTPRVRPFALGLTAGLLPLLGFASVVGSSMLDNIIVGRMQIDARLPWTSAQLSVQLLFGILLLATAHMITRAAIHRTRRDVSFALLCLFLLPQSFQRLDSAHVLFNLCFIGPLAVASAFADKSLFGGDQAWEGPRSRVAGGLAVAVCVLTAGTAFLWEPAPEREVTWNGRSFIARSPEERALIHESVMALTSRVSPGSRLFVGAQDMSLPTLTDVRLYYLLPQYRASGYFLDLPAGVAESAGSGLVRDIATADALVLLSVSHQSSTALFPRMRRGSSEANDVVTEMFCEIHRNRYSAVYTRCR